MKEALIGLLPRILPGIDCRFIIHEGRQDLERSIPRKLRAWQSPSAQFVVIRDQDSSDCHDLKAHLGRLCQGGGREGTLVRIACRELESWFLGDLAAVEAATGLTGMTRLQAKRKYRDPDRLGNPKEELRKLVRSYQPISGARAIGPHLNLSGNRSRSFQVFVSGIRSLVAPEE